MWQTAHCLQWQLLCCFSIVFDHIEPITSAISSALLGRYEKIWTSHAKKFTGDEFQEPRVHLLISRFIPMIEECNSQVLASTAWALAVLQVGDVGSFGGFTRPNLPHKWFWEGVIKLQIGKKAPAPGLKRADHGSDTQLKGIKLQSFDPLYKASW